MWPFKKRVRLPDDWKETIRACDFSLARTELQNFFEMAKREAPQGQEVFYREEFVAGWKSFSADPRFETAVDFIEKAPEYGATLLLPYFVECCPGGRFKLYKDLLGQSSPRREGEQK